MTGPSHGGHLARLIAAAAIALAVSALGLPAVSGDPSNTTTVVGGGTSTQRDVVTLLAGSPDYLVFELQHVMTGDLGGSGVPTSPPYQVVARATDGTSRTVTTDTAYVHWSLAGDLLAALDASDNSKAGYWNLATRQAGKLSIPPTGQYVAASPSGVLYMTPDGTLEQADTSGVSVPLAQPFTSRPAQFSTAVDANGVVLGDDSGDARYVAFNDPHRVHDLQSGTDGRVTCRALSATYAACMTAREGENLKTAALIPLDGSAPTALRIGNLGKRAALALSGPSRMVWPEFANTSAAAVVLASLDAGSTTPTVGTQPVSGDLVSALGAAQTTKPERHQILQASAADHVTTVTTAPRSPVTASTLALTGKRLVDIDDGPVPSHPGARVAVRSRPLTVAGGTVKAGPTTVLRAETRRDPAVERVVGSGTEAAYLTTPAGGRLNLHVRRDSGEETVIHRIPLATRFVLSGHWLAYYRIKPGHGLRQLHVRNLMTGRDRTLGKRGDRRQATLSGHHLAYTTQDGAIYRLNLHTGNRVRLSPSIGIGHFENVLLFGFGHYVGWDIWRGGNRYTDALRNVHSMAPPRHFQHRLIGLSAAGALLSDVRADELAGGPSTVRLHPWHGRTRQVLPAARYLAVQANHDLIAWVTIDGTLDAAPLN